MCLNTSECENNSEALPNHGEQVAGDYIQRSRCLNSRDDSSEDAEWSYFPGEMVEIISCYCIWQLFHSSYLFNTDMAQGPAVPARC